MSLAERVILFCWTYIFPIVVVVYLSIVLYEFLLHERRKKRRAKYLPKEDEGEFNESRNFKDIEWKDSTPPTEQDKIKNIPFTGATATLNSDALKAAARFYEIARDRRSVRKFSSRPVDLAIIERCILAAGTSPSLGPEPWTFCLVSDGEIKAQIREITESERSDASKDYLTVAPHLVLIFVKSSYGSNTDYAEEATSIATGILLCALQAAGLNSLLTTPLNCGSLSKLLGRPVAEKLLFLIPVGYAADDCQVPVLRRKPVEEILVKY
ncbi:iodotyrosine dehalogenase 1 [Culex quinquefasciatus]|uniref:Iodotyrosine dehalogenase 1 n=1 Tax=Culex quinquefasciatus TaxID=7176 RepID=B0WYA9_CULQU|nr:iodotyrosine dehalogenase 1 [Culex quinquefasciatus]|eukprot:XP_001862381.1 iodotyrosine dehalogenase 1 [Culex quinquefasciatus]